jgi:hypothetical protein
LGECDVIDQDDGCVIKDTQDLLVPVFKYQEAKAASSKKMQRKGILLVGKGRNYSTSHYVITRQL